MARMARIVVPGYPHCLTQRGNRGQRTFFRDQDYAAYLELMAEWCGKHQVEIWAYCLMPSHVHLIAVPASESGLRLAVGEAHRRYTRRINSRKGWRGHLWQGRFGSHVVDDGYLLAAARYVEMSPVRARLVKRAKDWPWSSASAHLKRRDDALVQVAALLERVKSWSRFLAEPEPEGLARRLRMHESTGRPLGSDDFVARLEKRLRRTLAPQRPGRKPRQARRKRGRAAK
jgi:putative transposase